MTTFAAVPAISTLVEVTAADEAIPGVRIEHVRGAELTLSLPAGVRSRPTAGTTVTLRWPAGHRGRYAVPGIVVGLPADRVLVELTSEPELEQHRRYVRGGGGEEILLHRPGTPPSDGAVGSIRDISEQGVRARFRSVTLSDGDAVRLTMRLGEETIEVSGTALRVTGPGGDDAADSCPRAEVIAAFQPDERQAQVIRRYVLQQQLLARARTAGH